MLADQVNVALKPPNAARGFCAFLGWVFAGIGCGLLWGAGAALVWWGAALFVMAAVDDALERITGIGIGERKDAAQ